MSALVLWVTLVFPSIYVVEKEAGWMAVALHAIVAALAIRAVPSVVRRLPDRAIGLASAATLIAVVLLFALMFPAFNVQEPGRGSDDDDAHDVGVRALVAGASPYAERTYLGNELHQLPGAYILAAPFVLAGTSALQNFLWLPLFFLVVRRETGDARAALALAWLVLVASPAVLHQIVTGSSYATNTISVLLGLWWLTRTDHRALAAVAWGVTLASRPNFLFLLPLAFGWIARRHGWRAAIGTTGLAAMVVAGLTLPFYLADPANFGPLQAGDRLTRINQLVPHADFLLLTAMGALSVGLAVLPMTTTTLFRNAALIQALPVVAGTLSASLLAGRFNAEYTSYGAFFAWFTWMALVGPLTVSRRLH